MESVGVIALIGLILGLFTSLIRACNADSEDAAEQRE